MSLKISSVRFTAAFPSPPSAAYMRQQTRSALVQVMACRLFGTKPLPEPILAYCQLDSWEQISGKFESEFYHFHSRKCIWNCRLPKWWPFFPGGDGLICSLDFLYAPCLLKHGRPGMLHNPGDQEREGGSWQSLVWSHDSLGLLGSKLSQQLLSLIQGSVWRTAVEQIWWLQDPAKTKWYWVKFKVDWWSSGIWNYLFWCHTGHDHNFWSIGLDLSYDHYNYVKFGLLVVNTLRWWKWY